MMPEMPIEAFEVFATGLDHPECVAFDQQGYLWAGGEAGQVYRIDPHSVVETITVMDGFCAGLAFSPAGELYVCNAKLGIVHVTKSGAHSVFAARAGEHQIVCANYAVFDRHGNLFVTDSGNWKRHNGYLLRFDPDGNGKVVGGPYGYANGLALSAGEEHLFMVESDTNRVYRFTLDPEGAPGAPQLYASDAGRFPDGLALDSVENLYIACYASDEIYRISPRGEKTLLAHDPWGILLGRPTNLAFGGSDFTELYVANLGRTTITRTRLRVSGQPLANQRMNDYA